MDFVDFLAFDSLSGFLAFLFLSVGTGFFEKWTWLVELAACQACSGLLRLAQACPGLQQALASKVPSY